MVTNIRWLVMLWDEEEDIWFSFYDYGFISVTYVTAAITTSHLHRQIGSVYNSLLCL